MARFINPPGSGGDADIADFVFTNEGEEESSTVNISNKDMIIQTTRDNEDIDADINIESADDIFITANGDDVTINAADQIRLSSGTIVRVQTGSGSTWEFGDGGGLDFPGNGNIFNPTNTSGDGLGLSTLELQPDLSVTNDRYIVIDPTEPNHIHIRAGGAIDNSNAELFLGGEQANVHVIDSDHEVYVRTNGPIPVVSLANTNSTTPSNVLVTPTPNNVSIGWVVYDGENKAGNMATVTNVILQGSFPSEEYLITVDVENFFINGNTYYFYDEINTQENNWTFGNDGYLYGPSMGLIKATGIINEDNAGLLGLGAANYILMQGVNGVFLNDASVAGNQVATLGDVGIETEYPVSGGTIGGTQPTFTGDPLFAGHYIRMSSDLVHFEIQVDFDNITNFGTGQYYVTLPFDAKYAYQFRDGCLHDASPATQYQVSGHVIAGSNQLLLSISDKVGGAVEDKPFTSTAPITLTTADNFHIAGTYIAEAIV